MLEGSMMAIDGDDKAETREDNGQRGQLCNPHVISHSLVIDIFFV